MVASVKLLPGPVRTVILPAILVSLENTPALNVFAPPWIYTEPPTSKKVAPTRSLPVGSGELPARMSIFPSTATADPLILKLETPLPIFVRTFPPIAQELGSPPDFWETNSAFPSALVHRRSPRTWRIGET